MAVTATPVSGYGQTTDLVSSTYCTQALAAGGNTLTSGQSLILPTLISAASKEIVRFCGRRFDLAAYNEILTPEGGRQDRGEPATAKLGNFPIQSITSVRTGRSTVLTVANADSAANQLASVAFAVSGDVEWDGLTYTGVNLSRTASGTTTTNSLSFTDYTTVSSLATAINALSGGWSATVASGTPSPGLLPTSELVGGREPKGALGTGACLDAFTCDATGYDINRKTGICRFYDVGGYGYVPGYGFPGDGLADLWGGAAWGRTQYRVRYTAGFATIPESIQQVCVELVKMTYERLKTDATVSFEATSTYSYKVQQTVSTLPEWALQILYFYKDNWI